MRIRPFAFFFIVLVLVPAAVIALTSQRAQIGIAIVINVTPNPLGYLHSAPSVPVQPIVAMTHFRAVRSPMKLPLARPYDAQALQISPGTVNLTNLKDAVAFATPQGAVEVQASISPNPNGTLLTSNFPEVDLNAEAGVPVTFTCAYQVTVDTAIASWQLKDGLATDFAGSATSFPGGDVLKNTYVTAPNPTSTPFVVYSTDGGSFAIVNSTTYGGKQTFCVDLTLLIPIATPGGTYVSNAIYTLYY